MGNLSDRIAGTVKQVLAEITGSVGLKHEGETQYLIGKLEGGAAQLDEDNLDQIAQDDQELYEYSSKEGGSAPVQDVAGAEQAARFAHPPHADGPAGYREELDGREPAAPANVAEDHSRTGKL